MVYELQARCYGNLGDREKQQQALRRLVEINPKELKYQRMLIADVLSSGKIDEASGKIDEAIARCRLLVAREPAYRLELAGLLIEQNKRRPEPQRNWNEINQLIEQAAKDSPQSIKPVELKVELLLARGDQTADLAQRLTDAMAFFEPNGKPAVAGQEGKALTDPADRRVLARLLFRQTTPVHRKRAIEILESLAGENLANSNDRFDLARLYDVTGDWPKARLEYHELDLKTRNSKDTETLTRRPVYLRQYAASLLHHRNHDDKDDLKAAQALADDIKMLEPKALATVMLQVQHRTGPRANRPGRATDPSVHCPSGDNSTGSGNPGGTSRKDTAIGPGRTTLPSAGSPARHISAG